MLLYWAMFTVGFWAGAILSFKLFATKKPEEEELPSIKDGKTFVLLSNTKMQSDDKSTPIPVNQTKPQTISES